MKERMKAKEIVNRSKELHDKYGREFVVWSNSNTEKDKEKMENAYLNWEKFKEKEFLVL